jgi:hypothetical protein
MDTVFDTRHARSDCPQRIESRDFHKEPAATMSAIRKTLKQVAVEHDLLV